MEMKKKKNDQKITKIKNALDATQDLHSMKQQIYAKETHTHARMEALQMACQSSPELKNAKHATSAITAMETYALQTYICAMAEHQ